MTGLEEIERAHNALRWTRTDCLSEFKAAQILEIIKACCESDWDILPDQLTHDERHYASAFGYLSPSAIERLRALYG